MPVFELQGPDGTTYEVEGPDAAGAFDAFKRYRAAPPVQVAENEADVQRLEQQTGQYKPPGWLWNQAKDIERAVDTGAAKAVAGALGGAADLGGLAQKGVENVLAWAQNRPYEDVHAERAKNYVVSPQTLEALGSEAMQRRLTEGVGPLEGIGALYEPKTRAGRFAETGTNFAVSALAGPGNAARNFVGYGIVPGLASEAAGQLAEASGSSPYAQTAARVAGGLTGGLGSAAVLAPTAAERAVRGAARSLTPQQMAAAEALYGDAQARGLPLSWFNAVDQATRGATNLSGVQRVVEGSGRLSDFFAPSADAARREAGAAFDTLAPVNPNPGGIGPAVGQAAERTIGDVTARINRTTRPLYQAAEQQRVGPPIHQALTGDELYARTLQEVRNNPELNRTIANLPDDAVGVIDLVQRRLRERGENAAVPGQATTSNLAASNFNEARQPAIAAAEMATGGPQGAYAQARETQAALRERFLAPLMNGPLGRLQNEPTTRQAIEALFPSQPLANSSAEVFTAVDQLARRNPRAARDLVRAHLESTFNEAASNLQSGPNQFTGPRAAVALRGNPQQAQNLDAALRASVGDQVADGVNRLLDVFEAQGRRQRIGSQTSFNRLTGIALRSKSGGRPMELTVTPSSDGRQV
jgi:hypothetical protein